MGTRWKGKGSKEKALANPISRPILDLKSSLIKSNSQGILSVSGYSVLLETNSEQANLLDLTCFGQRVITVNDKQDKDKELFELTLEEAFYLCFSLKCIEISSVDHTIKTHNELWDYMTSQKASFPYFFKAYSHLRDKNWVVMSGDQFGVDFVAYHHHPSLVHSEYAVLVMSEENEDINDRLRVWSDLHCMLRLSGNVAKTVLTLYVNKGANLVGSFPSCLEGYSVEELTITRWDPQRCREDQGSESCQRSCWFDGHKEKCDELRLSSKSSLQRRRNSASVALVPCTGNSTLIKKVSWNPCLLAAIFVCICFVMEIEDWAAASSGGSSDSDVISDDSDNEDHCSASGDLPRSPQFRKYITKARWKRELGMAEIISNKGTMWTTTGIVRGGKIYAFLEDVLFLVEIGALHLLDDEDKCIPLENIIKKVAAGVGGSSLESFEVYRHLKNLGYIIKRRGVSWSRKCCKTVPAHGESGSQTIIDNRNEDVDFINEISELYSTMKINEVRPVFDVYPPNSKFRKSSPGNPMFILCISSRNLPTKKQIEDLQRQCEGIRLKICYVERRRVSFVSFNRIELRVLP